MIHISDQRRDLMFRVLDGEAGLLPLMFHFQKMRRCDRMLSWLVKNELTGRKLVGWIKHEQEGSFLKTLAFVQSKVNGDLGIKPVLVGEHYLTGGS